MVAIRLSAKRRVFKFPDELPKFVPWRSIPKGPKVNALKYMLPPTTTSNGRARALVVSALKEAAKNGVSLAKSNIVVDIGCSDSYKQFMVDKFPTITSTRAASFLRWIADLGRHVKLEQLLLLQGSPPGSIPFEKANVSRQRVAHMAGNAMSCNVLERLLPKVLYSTGIAPENATPCQWSALAGMTV